MKSNEMFSEFSTVSGSAALSGAWRTRERCTRQSPQSQSRANCQCCCCCCSLPAAHCPLPTSPRASPPTTRYPAPLPCTLQCLYSCRCTIHSSPLHPPLLPLAENGRLRRHHLIRDADSHLSPFVCALLAVKRRSGQRISFAPPLSRFSLFASPSVGTLVDGGSLRPSATLSLCVRLSGARVSRRRRSSSPSPRLRHALSAPHSPDCRRRRSWLLLLLLLLLPQPPPLPPLPLLRPALSSACDDRRRWSNPPQTMRRPPRLRGRPIASSSSDVALPPPLSPPPPPPRCRPSSPHPSPLFEPSRSFPLRWPQPQRWSPSRRPLRLSPHPPLPLRPLCPPRV